ncbi:conserved hypothetical protein [Ricinus communis]|uniref:Uncharacterized protein n=1 Tax=Ricinus communis TaxID=3988 RepID=B9T5X4_RICCO|nr:conserved hypothetical protein [Ricinus communis]
MAATKTRTSNFSPNVLAVSSSQNPGTKFLWSKGLRIARQQQTFDGNRGLES